jgi:hypothetical protein
MVTVHYTSISLSTGLRAFICVYTDNIQYIEASTIFMKAQSITKFTRTAKTQTFVFWEVNWKINCSHIMLPARYKVKEHG